MTERATRQFQRAPFEPLERMRKQLMMTDDEFGKALGYGGGGTVSAWRTNAEAPRVALIAAECLVRRTNPDARPAAPEARRFITLRLDDEDSAALLDLMLERLKGVKVVWKS